MSHVFAIGIGPGDPHLLTMQARETLANCTAVAGYRPYLESLGELLAGKRLLEGQAMRQEVLRCTLALEAALAGETVAVVSSGTPASTAWLDCCWNLLRKNDLHKSMWLCLVSPPPVPARRWWVLRS